MPVSHRFLRFFRILIFATIGLMALGAGVRTMGAGLSCPDWPLCFGRVIPDFHVSVYFEFIHRAYAGLIAILFFASAIFLWTRKSVPFVAKWLAGFALFALLAQIVMGGLTVLQLLKVSVVTSHLLLATVFVSTLFLISNILEPKSIERATQPMPRWFSMSAGVLPVATFLQIWLGGLVASSYAGMVCLDFPKCNGQWIPTLSGVIGFQVMHRLGAYALTLAVCGFALMTYLNREKPWMTKQVLRLSRWLGVIVILQVGIGVANLMFFIPAWLTVLHQSNAILLLLLGLRTVFVTSVRYGHTFLTLGAIDIEPPGQESMSVP